MILYYNIVMSRVRILTRAAKDMARKIKAAQQQAISATTLWQAAERKLTAWEQNHPEQVSRLPATTTEAFPAPPRVTMIDESTATDIIQTISASTLTDSLHKVDACTTTEPVQPIDQRGRDASG